MLVIGLPGERLARVAGVGIQWPNGPVKGEHTFGAGALTLLPW